MHELSEHGGQKWRLERRNLNLHHFGSGVCVLEHLFLDRLVQNAQSRQKSLSG